MARGIAKQTRALFILLFFMLFITGFIMINYKDPQFYQAGLYYTVLIMMAMVLYWIIPQILPRRGDEVGLDVSKFVPDVFLGSAVGLVFIIGNLLTPAISLGLPSLPASIIGARYLVVGFVAPIAEESVFRGALSKLMSRFTNNDIFVAIATAGAFTGYHLLAYGGSLASGSGAFFGAFLFGILAHYVVKWRRSLLPAMVLHMVFNIFLLAKPFVVVG